MLAPPLSNYWGGPGPPSSYAYDMDTPCYFSPLSEIPGSVDLLENSLTYEGVQWRKIIERI